jgi:hypothetical protein
MTVDRIVDQASAAAHFGDPDIWKADDHLIAVKGSGTPLKFGAIPVSPTDLAQIEFITPRGNRGVAYNRWGDLDQQAFRSVREITPATAALFDSLL